jgi:protein subunit release factor B
MIFNKLGIVLFSLLTITLFAKDIPVDNLLEKVQHANTAEEKQLLIEQLKQKLAQANKKAREESNAIIEAKKKLPSQNYNDSSLKK